MSNCSAMADPFDALTENALEFLENALDDLAQRPKTSVITFYAAVELFLKARLLQEHWTLVVRREPELKAFQEGAFESITYKEARGRLQNVLQSPLSEDAHAAFETVRRHRNRIIHFFHDGSEKERAKIAGEQLRAWYALNQLLTVQWSPHFDRWRARIGAIEKRLSKHREYLRAKFHDLTKLIETKKAAGAIFANCESCKFHSAEIEAELDLAYTAKCLVCDHRDYWLNITCSECDAQTRTELSCDFRCSGCGHKVALDDLVSYLDQDDADVSSGDEPKTPANCGWCDGYHSVVTYDDKFVCTQCLEVTEEMYFCGWCNEPTTKEIEDSYLSGCGQCDGRIGWKDD